MRLPPDQVQRFYSIWKPLLLFVNRERQIVPDMLRPDFAGPWVVESAVKIRDALWQDDALREAFIAQNPAALPAKDLAIVASWQFRRAGKFYAYRHLKKHSIFLSAEHSAVYAVLGLASSFEELLPFTPCLLETVLIPFGEQITIDTFIAPHNISFGSGIRRIFDKSYKDAKERGAIITSLLPPEPSPAARTRSQASSNVKYCSVALS